MTDVEEKLKSKVLDWEEIRLVQDSKKTYFVSEERYNTGATLFTFLFRHCTAFCTIKRENPTHIYYCLFVLICII